MCFISPQPLRRKHWIKKLLVDFLQPHKEKNLFKMMMTMMMTIGYFGSLGETQPQNKQASEKLVKGLLYLQKTKILILSTYVKVQALL